MAMDKVGFKVWLSFYLLPNDNTEVQFNQNLDLIYVKVGAIGLVLAGNFSGKRTVCRYILRNLD